MRLKTMTMISMFIMLLLVGQSITSHLDQIPGEDRSTELESKTIVMHSNNSTDSDGDGVIDIDDDCPNGSSNWTSNYSTDHDSDGCQDNGEDLDDDNDGVVDINDSCPKGDLNWNSNNNTDADEDGCQDSTEDGDGGINPNGNDAHCLTIGNVSMTSTYLLSFDLVNICSFHMNYPGANASADHPSVSGLPNTYSWWFYAIGPNSSYNFSFQLSFDENISNNTVVNLIINPTILSCGGNNSWHQCPDSSANYTFTYVQLSNNSGGNNSGGNNTDGNNTGGDNTDGNNSGGGNTGGNNTGGNNNGGNNNNQTGCGYTMENSSIHVYQNNPWMNSGEYLSFSAYVDCMVIGETIEISYILELQDNITNQITLIEQSSNTWIVNNISSVYSFQTGVLYGGAYALTTTLTYSDSSLTVDSSSFTFGISMADSDGDGIENMFDNCRNESNSAQQDLDGDGIGDACDSDIDNDNVANEMDAYPYNASEQYDTDGDGIGNNVDNDDDNDGLADYSDAFPLDASEQMDSDGDGIGNNADADDDGDGIIDELDNCRLNPNANQSDGDSDGFGTVCDIDEGSVNVGNNNGNNISNNVTIDADDVSALPSLGVLGTMLAVTVGLIATTRRFEEE